MVVSFECSPKEARSKIVACGDNIELEYSREALVDESDDCTG